MFGDALRYLDSGVSTVLAVGTYGGGLPRIRDRSRFEAAWLRVLSGLVTKLGVRPGTAGQEREE